MKITFNLDGSGVYMYPYEPVHIDALLTMMTVPKKEFGIIGRNDIPKDYDLPLEKHFFGEDWVWAASAVRLFIKGESIQYWRKRFRQGRIELTKGSPNTGSGKYRDYNIPMPLLIADKAVSYAIGDIGKITKLFSNLKYLGKKTAYGKGRINSIIIEEIEDDFTIEKNGAYMRVLPVKNGPRYGRIRPPYWNITQRCRTNYVGDKI